MPTWFSPADRKIGRDKIKYNPNTHSYGCGVDIKHFGKARLKSTKVPADVADLPGPVFGFFGVVDERMDYELVAKLADAYPHGSVVIIGPMTKIDPAAVPQRPNLHWLGGPRLPTVAFLREEISTCV